MTYTLVMTVYTPAGAQVQVEIAGEDLVPAAELDSLLASAGYSTTPPGPDAETVKITTVVRRTARDGTPVIDFYPDWSVGGKFGQYRSGLMYLNTPDDVSQFQAQSGLQLSEIPVFEGGVFQRDFNRRSRYEVSCRKPFLIKRVPNGVDEQTGHNRYKYEYAAPVSVSSTPEPAPEPRTAPGQLPPVQEPDDIPF